jgi:plasmid stabilization system protein ParE
MNREPLPIVFEHRASLEIEAADAWWRTNRTAAPDLFLTEFERILQAVSLLPELGAPARSARIAGVRRILLARTRHYIYYRPTNDVIQVLALWHTSRGQPPRL